MSTISEPNTILEINEAHVDNFMIVIPRLPPAPYMGSVFNGITKHVNSGSVSASSSPPDDCPPEQTNQIQREHNLDLVNFKLFISAVTTPGITVAKYEVPTQFSTLSRAGKIQFSDFSTTMQVSENFLNYNTILNWMYMIHNPEEYNKMSGRAMVDNVFTDIYLIITNNHRQKVAEYKFLDAFPSSLTPLNMSFKSADKINSDVTWSHSGMFPSNTFILKYI